MDWIDEKIEIIRQTLRHVSLKKALMAYILVFAVITIVLTIITKEMCVRWSNLVWKKYEVHKDANTQLYGSRSIMSEKDSFLTMFLDFVENYCVVVYAVGSMFLASLTMYRLKLKIPLLILENGTKEIKKNNLDFSLFYDSTDELGALCTSFEEMRVELIGQKQSMWDMLEEKKQLNAAFAHDLRTPLTVLRGYTDILIRYVPEEKISKEKLITTLQTMAEQIVRLEQFSNTMKNIHSLEDIPIVQENKYLHNVWLKISGICEALNMVGGVNLICENQLKDNAQGLLDMQIVLEVVENLLSNSIRYARGKVVITLCNTEEALTLYVHDDGNGFQEEALKKATTAYYGEENKKDSAHFGLGLYMSNLLCVKHGGTLNIANSIEKGALVSAEFKISLINLNKE